jgi:hypothetical protein
MSTYLIDFDKESHNFSSDNLIIDNRIDINKDTFKYLLYYNDKNSAKEIYIKTPKIRLTYDWTNIKYSHLKIKITPKYEKTNAFIDFIKKLEEDIINKIPIKKKKLEFRSLLEENNAHYLKTFYDENNIKITSDMKDKVYKITDFKANAEIQLVIKLSNIWQKNGAYGLSSRIYQIKYYALPEDHNINFFDEEVKYVPKRIECKLEEIEKLPIKIPFMIDPKMLQSIKLKPLDPK